MILEEYDKELNAVINPSDLRSRIKNMPEVAVACFANDLFQSIVDGGKCTKIGVLPSPNIKRPIYEIEYKSKRIALFMISVGAPLASMDLEEMHAMGCNKFIVFGNCGVLENMDDCSIIIPTKAIRDEGTSYHYKEVSRTIELNKKYKEEFKEILEEFEYPFIEGTTWTTDAFYRETKEKVKRRREEGAITVEMESSALQAVADFRGFDFFTFFYAGDNLSTPKWEQRSLSNEVKLDEKSQIAYLALELAFKISK